jgi:Putative metal-binding motif
MTARPLAVWMLLAGCGAADADFDGFAGAEDCDDSDPFVYPGAPEDPGDGIDADCTGDDPPLAIVGEWDITYFEAGYSSFVLFQPGTAVGTLTVLDDLETLVDVTATLDPSLTGGIPFDLAFVLSGASSPVPGPDTFALYAEAELYDESVHVDWDCSVVEGGAKLTCAGELKALEIGMDAAAEFERSAAR